MVAPSPQKSFTNSQSGNILIYILGAIFLLGLLVITVRGSNTPGAGIDPEQLAIRVAEVQQYGDELERAVTYVLRNGHSEVDIRFAHPDAASAYGDITDIPSRQVFSRDGGGAAYREPPRGIQTSVTPWHFTARNAVARMGTNCSTNACVDLTAILQNVTKDFCLLINQKSNITNTAGAPPQDSGTVLFDTEFSGDYTFGAWIDDNAELAQNPEGCFEGDTAPPSGTYHYYRVLLAR